MIVDEILNGVEFHKFANALIALRQITEAGHGALDELVRNGGILQIGEELLDEDRE